MFKELICLLLCGLSFCHANTSFVTGNVMGQLGNQLFQIATIQSYAWDHDVHAFFPDLHSEWYNIPHNREHMFFRLDASSPPRAHSHQFAQSAPQGFEPIPELSDLYLYGYLQSWKYFHHHREKILDLFAPSDVYTTYLENKYGDLLAHPYTVALHVRTYSRWKHETNTHPFVGLDYYKEAIGYFPEDALFVVFSDRIEWCKKHFSQLCKNVVFIEGNDHIADLYLMSRMKHMIMGASTFSWWGAYLNRNCAKIVIAPDQWIHPSYIPCRNYLRDYYLPEWNILRIEFGEYPEDIEGQSTSIDDC